MRAYGRLMLFYKGDGFLILRKRVCVLRLPVGIVAPWDLLCVSSIA